MSEETTFSKSESSHAADDPWSWLMNLACRMEVAVPLAHLTVSDLLNLEVGSIVESGHREGQHVLVRVNGQAIGWAEFDFVDDMLAVRLTELM